MNKILRIHSNLRMKTPTYETRLFESMEIDFFRPFSHSISMGYCKKDVNSLLTHWSCIFLALTHRFYIVRRGTSTPSFDFGSYETLWILLFTSSQGISVRYVPWCWHFMRQFHLLVLNEWNRILLQICSLDWLHGEWIYHKLNILVM